MTNYLKTQLVLARCNRNRQPFGIRLDEQTKDQWFMVNTFPVGEKQTNVQASEQANISGAFSLAATYAGCPHCMSRSIFACSCGKLSCWDGTTKQVICPWCQLSITLGGTIRNLSNALSDL